MRQILVVDADSSMRRKTRLGLEIDGAYVLEAGTVSQARHQAFAQGLGDDGFDGIVIAPQLPDGDGLDLVPEMRAHWPSARMVVVTEPNETCMVPNSLASVDRGDIPSLIEALGQPIDLTETDTRGVVELLRHEHEALAADWAELCRWDPMLPPEAQPPRSGSFIAAIISALSRPQPLGWGADPDVERAADVFASSMSSIEIAVGQLVCLREAIRRRIAGRVPLTEMLETTERLQMIVDRAIGVAVSRMSERLQEQAYVDALTGLLNRRALRRDLRREAARASRHHRRFSVMVLDMDGLKRVNDSQGHAAGDEMLRAMARSMRAALRVGDQAYRIGGDEFVVVLPETEDDRAGVVANRIRTAGSPSFSWGSVTFPNDGTDLDDLIDLADQRLFAQRRLVRGTTDRLA